MISRIKHILEQKNLPPSRFADKIGVPRSTVSHILSGRNKPSLEVIQKILNAFPDIPIQWLMQGKGNYNANTYTLFDSGSSSEGIENYEEIAASDDTEADDIKRSANNQESSHPEPESKEVPVRDKQEVLSRKDEKHAGSVEKVIILYNDGTFKEYKPSF